MKSLSTLLHDQLFSLLTITSVLGYGTLHSMPCKIHIYPTMEYDNNYSIQKEMKNV